MTSLALVLSCLAVGVALAYWQGRDDGRRAERKRRADVYRNIEWTGEKYQ